MDKYLNEVSKYLKNIPVDERQDIMNYYEEYFLDAGFSYSDLVRTYGSSKQFARDINLNYLLEQDDNNLLEKSSNNGKSAVYLTWLVVLVLFASPILFPVALVLVFFIMILAFLLLIFLFILYVVTFVLLGGGVVELVSGIAVLFQGPATSAFVFGQGLIMIGIGLILCPLLVKITQFLVGKFMDFIKWIGRKISKRQSSRQEGVSQ